MTDGSDPRATFAVVTTTVASAEEAKALARSLVEQRLAACVQILPAQSIYRWEGAIEDTSEWLLLCKIRAEDYASVEAALLAEHSYDTPEVIMTPIAGGSPTYLAWLGEGTRR